LAANGSAIALHWDVATCAAADYKVLYGSLVNVASSTIDGAACALGTSGSAPRGGVPGGDTLRNNTGSCP
jgi:hypothetical protein